MRRLFFMEPVIQFLWSIFRDECSQDINQYLFDLRSGNLDSGFMKNKGPFDDSEQNALMAQERYETLKADIEQVSYLTNFQIIKFEE